MLMFIANVGDKVRYNDVEYMVGNLGFKKQEVEGFYSALNAELHYFLDEISLWVDASLCEPVGQESSEEFFKQSEFSPELEELAHSMVKWMDGQLPRPDNSKLPAVFTLLSAIQYHKEGGYGSSWKGKGEYRGIMSNIDRKYDRLDRMTERELDGTLKTLKEQEELLARDYDFYSQEVGESKVDAVADLTNYGMLYMTFIMDNFPNVFRLWVERNLPAYLRDNIPFVSK